VGQGSSARAVVRFRRLAPPPGRVARCIFPVLAAGYTRRGPCKDAPARSTYPSRLTGAPAASPATGTASQHLFRHAEEPVAKALAPREKEEQTIAAMKAKCQDRSFIDALEARESEP